MNLWSGYIGIAAGFFILSSIVLWFFIHTRGKPIAKAGLVLAVVWFSLVIYHNLISLSGYPAAQPVPPDSRILAVRVEEPSPSEGRSGAIYFWAASETHQKEQAASAISWLDFFTLFPHPSPEDPRAYKLPYSRQMHKEIIEAQKQAEGTPGAQLRMKEGARGKSGGGKNENSASGSIQVVHPRQLLPKH